MSKICVIRDDLRILHKEKDNVMHIIDRVLIDIKFMNCSMCSSIHVTLFLTICGFEYVGCQQSS